MSPAGPSPSRLPLTRPTQGRLVGGVAQGVAEHLGLDAGLVRLLFALTSLIGGAGLLAYVLLWIFTPQDKRTLELLTRAQHMRVSGRPGAHEAAHRVAEAARAATGRRGWADGERVRVLVVGLAMLTAGVAVLASQVGIDLRWQVTGPLLVVLTGAVLGLAQLDDAERHRWLSPMGGTGPAGVARLVGGVVLAVTGVLLLVVPTLDLSQLTLVAVATVAVLAGTALVIAPWGVRLWRDLESERSLRVRETERAEIAAHLHDSVLQTLSLIQRRPGDEAEVARLARAQERELRDWIYGSEMRSGTADPSSSSVREAVRAVCAEVEDAEAVPVEVVIVGDRDGDDHTTALVQALREAVLNAARHGGTGVSVFVECAGGVEAFVRDRGPGFDLDAVPADRLGVRRSIVGRMQRHGGRAIVRRAPGGGTEVALTLPPAAQPPGDDAAPAPPPEKAPDHVDEEARP